MIYVLSKTYATMMETWYYQYQKETIGNLVMRGCGLGSESPQPTLKTTHTMIREIRPLHKRFLSSMNFCILNGRKCVNKGKEVDYL